MSKIISMLIAAVVTTTACSVGNNIPNTNDNPLDGKTVVFVGDSISYGTNYHGGYGKLIGEQNNMTVVNPSLGGATIARNVKWSEDAEGYRPCIIDMVDNLEGEYNYIIIEGGINDFWNHVPLGELTDGFDGGYDENTMAGGLESMFSVITENYPESKTGFVIMHDPFTYDAEEGFAPYYEMMKSVCDKWNISYLDLYAQNNMDVGVNVRDAEQRKLYFESNDRSDGDGCHPNELGYQTIYVEPMTGWMKSL
ncbi:MAG: SGNH/GDSL hydrolase family protein [Hominilimicola sp.]